MFQTGHYASTFVDDDELLMLRAMLNHLPVGICLFDRELKLRAINRLLVQMLDFPRRMFEGGLPTLEELTLFNALRGEYGPGDAQQQTRERMARARTGEAHRFQRTRPNGQVLEMIGVPLPNGGFVSIYTDITEQRQIETTLRAQALYLHSVVDHLPQGITVFDEQLRLKCWNATVLDVLEFPPGSAYQDAPYEELMMYPARRGEYGPGDPAEQVAQHRARALKFEAHRFERTRPNGRTHLVEGRPMQMDGRTVGFVTSYTDITTSRERESALAEKTALLQTLVNNLPSGVSIFDANLDLVLINQQAIDLLGFTPEVLQQHPNFAGLARWNVERGEYGDVDVESVVAAMMDKAAHPVAHRMERTRPNGTVIELRGAPIPHGGFVTIYSDVTEQKTIERELRQQSEVFQTLVDNIPGGVTLFGSDQRLLAYNKEYARLLDFPAHLFDGVPTLERFFSYNAARGEYGAGDAETQVQQLLARARLHQPHQFQRTRPDGTILEIRGLPLADGSFVTIYTDVTEQHRAAEAIERLAHRDTLTGLANRYTLEARLDQLVADARRHERRLAVMFLDMDNFKAINDTLGHGVGDQFLCEVAHRLRACVRDNDIVARLGGDEFVVVLTELIDLADATGVAAKIIDALSQPVALGNHALRACASIGICYYPQDGHDRGALMQSADIAMYHAKNAGKGVFHSFDAAMMTAASSRLEMERTLREAVSQRQFVLHYQPQLDATGLQATGVEALIRWQKPGGELVLPGEFIALAEELGLINEIGDWALRTACHTLARWRQQGLPELSMAVNLSALQLRNARLAQSIADVLQASGLPGSALTLEITESVAMRDPQASIELLGSIRNLGVRVAIDDFGTGYSSLAYLTRLPLDYIKLDRAFVQHIETDSNDAAICAATIGLAHNLGLAVVAEGVETQAQRHYLNKLGCDAFQGYLFSRALSEAAAYDWLASLAGTQRTVKKRIN
ncbi:MAG: PAS-domain containing protein [Gammaproteobacteria bacterium]|uniref:PAS-domain containing protein n=1 Tax=Rhodoferax sp. TaxID=50421 RepID=UPI0017A905AC|nr:PAS-domain containing protein [Rhodoferax sp.]MBU3900569.1 PAS-domain containing protein [Gammaproteobacteria bacterium]MBA3057526.1 EAL domain-containing protein [Rhodoferax sp.]MBU3996474.1 PAS-domain containing protein [Gammaproteobacteria bacterium]MBU4080014.1 PAS-domain containing protein [Gammaproteobacteria bacterium]MBU4113470.1 PAS-domain containing protein [Gammaproteobacteria bacterium]